ncbi:hypothetical protein BU23DRAFT_308824 [Bimuria novae-zelandiae CBS 107.79]|uniref:Uncharacterized protein n=1 Tax=Bimuria novae-zelandiae CBS 107.79 TaxID=1447943 RepID=A0A6A5URF1_9PLEO|nr:hypothetical protein BU23DRAFT_308824 [Bimuria novae-zelandiae CBS 107.79]
MDELDTIAEDLGVHLDERTHTSTSIDPVQHLLSKVSKDLSRKSTRLRNKSVDSVLDEVPRVIDQEINERRLSKVLTCLATQPRRTSTNSQPHPGMVEVEAIPPEDIQAWLECAQTKLPAAIDAITAVMETLPAVEFTTGLQTEPAEESDGYLEYGEAIQYDEEFEQEELSEEYNDYSGELSQEAPPRGYTGPINQLKEKVANLKCKLREDSGRSASEENSGEEEARSTGESATIEPEDFQAPVMRMAEEHEDEGHSIPVQRITDRQNNLLSPSREATQHVESLSLVSWDQEDKTIEEEVVPLTVERVTSCRTLLLSRQPTVRRPETPSPVEIEPTVQDPITSRRRTSLRSRKPSVQREGAYSSPPADSEEHAYDPIGLQQKMQDAESGPEILSRQSVRRATLLPQSSPEPEIILRTQTRKSTVSRSRRPIIQPEESDFQLPIIRKATGFQPEKREFDMLSKQPTRRRTSIVAPAPSPEPLSVTESRDSLSSPSQRATLPDPQQEVASLEPSVVRKVTGPVPEDEPEPVISRISTHQLTNIPSRRSTTGDLVFKDDEPQASVVRQASGLEPEEEPGQEAVPRTSTRRLSAAPSQQSTVEEPSLDEHEDIGLETQVLRNATGFEPEEQEPRAISRAKTRKSTFLPSRRSTIQDISTPEDPQPVNVPSVASRKPTIAPSRRSTIQELSPEGPEEFDFQPPVIRKATGVLPDGPEVVSRAPTRRASDLPSRKSTFREVSPPEKLDETLSPVSVRSASRNSTTVPSRRSTFQEPSTREEPDTISRVSTRRPTIVPSRRSTFQEPSPQVEPDTLSRVPTKRSAIVPSRKSTFQEPPLPAEPDALSRVSTKRTSLVPSRNSPVQEPSSLEVDDFQPPVLRKATVLEPEEESAPETLQVPIRKNTTMSSPEPTAPEPSPLKENPPFHAPMMRKSTGLRSEHESELGLASEHGLDAISRMSSRRLTRAPSRKPTLQDPSPNSTKNHGLNLHTTR